MEVSNGVTVAYFVQRFQKKKSRLWLICFKWKKRQTIVSTKHVKSSISNPFPASQRRSWTFVFKEVCSDQLLWPWLDLCFICIRILGIKQCLCFMEIPITVSGLLWGTMQPSWHNKPHYWIPRRWKADVVMVGHFTSVHGAISLCGEKGAWCTVSGFGHSNRITYALFFIVWLGSLYISGAVIVQWLERQPRDRNVAGSSPCRRGGRTVFSRVSFPPKVQMAGYS